jgi:hypothetical protein
VGEATGQAVKGLVQLPAQVPLEQTKPPAQMLPQLPQL